MDPTRLTITLIPTSRSRDPVGPRVLVLGPGNYNAVVGRSSKVESKNLVPAEDNGWFDNRVMSRAHAEFTAIPKFQEVYLMDTNSMHGSLVNDIKLTGGRKTLLESNDVLTFGATVSRGSDTFAPLEVRLELKWEDIKPDQSPAKLLPSMNTFTVPDDNEFDDEDWVSEVEFVEEKPKNPVIEKDMSVVQIIDTDDEESEVAERDGSSALAPVPNLLNDEDSVLNDSSDMEEGLDYTPSEKDDVSMNDTDDANQEDADSEVSSSDVNSAVSPTPSSDKEQDQDQEQSLPTSPQTHETHTAPMSSHEGPFGTALYVDEHAQEKIQNAINAHKQAFENANRTHEQAKEKMEKRMGMHKQACENEACENAGAFHDITKNHLEKADRVAQQLSHNLYSFDVGNSAAKPPKPTQTPDVNKDTAQKESKDATNAAATAPNGSSSVTVNEPATSVQDSQTGLHIRSAPSLPPKSDVWPTRPTFRPTHDGSPDPWLFERRQTSVAMQPAPPLSSKVLSRRMFPASSSIYPSPYSPYNPPHNPLHESPYAQGPFAPPPRSSPIPTVSMSQVNAVHQHPPTPPSSANVPPFVVPSTSSNGHPNRPDGTNPLQCPPPAGGYSGREFSREDFATRDDWLSARLDNMLERMISTQDANEDVVHAKSRPLFVSRSDPRTIVQERGENNLKRKHGETETSIESPIVGKHLADQTPVTAPAAQKAAIEEVHKRAQSTNDLCAQEPATKVVQIATDRAKESEERPRKRTKSSHPSRTMTRYATTAIAGVVIGGVGAIVALAALPVGFFE